MGVSLTRLSPYFFHKPFVTCSKIFRVLAMKTRLITADDYFTVHKIITVITCRFSVPEVSMLDSCVRDNMIEFHCRQCVCMLLGTPESFLDQPRPLCILSKEVGPCSNRHVPLWQMPNDVIYCQQLPTVQAGGGCSDCTQLMSDVAAEWLKTYGSQMHSTQSQL